MATIRALVKTIDPDITKSRMGQDIIWSYQEQSGLIKEQKGKAYPTVAPDCTLHMDVTETQTRGHLESGSYGRRSRARTEEASEDVASAPN